MEAYSNFCCTSFNSSYRRSKNLANDLDKKASFFIFLELWQKKMEEKEDLNKNKDAQGLYYAVNEKQKLKKSLDSSMQEEEKYLPKIDLIHKNNHKRPQFKLNFEKVKVEENKENSFEYNKRENLEKLQVTENTNPEKKLNLKKSFKLDLTKLKSQSEDKEKSPKEETKTGDVIQKNDFSEKTKKLGIPLLNLVKIDGPKDSCSDHENDPNNRSPMKEQVEFINRKDIEKTQSAQNQQVLPPVLEEDKEPQRESIQFYRNENHLDHTEGVIDTDQIVLEGEALDPEFRMNEDRKQINEESMVLPVYDHALQRRKDKVDEIDPNKPQVARRPAEYDEDLEALDQRLFERRPREFNLEEFKKLCQKTYQEPNDPIPNVDDLLRAYKKYGLEKYSKYLSEDNPLNSVTSPSIDMGKAPYLFSYRENASSQIFLVPKCIKPHYMVVKYSNICPY
ncbi:unnamed protein product [Moneuplotes crassus]|uniref:Uncharacterized protein n=1 Tax=Euplotes crassus TaxID=5936 RepID=A0AAD2DB33_EUPCR|nr:unnamed protein product [Moneuplotes crassus]